MSLTKLNNQPEIQRKRKASHNSATNLTKTFGKNIKFTENQLISDIDPKMIK